MFSPARDAALDQLRSLLVDSPETGTSASRRGRTVEPKHAVRSMHFSSAQAHAIVKRGISSRALTPLSDYLGVGKGAAATYLDLDRATAMRKVAKGAMLPTHAAESLLRLLELDGLAAEAFETPDEAADWLRRAHPALEGESPLECAKSGFGAERARDILVAIRYGGVV